MDPKLARKLITTGISIAAANIFVACAQTPPLAGPQADSSLTAATAVATEPPTPETKLKESVRPPVKPVPVESKTPEESASRAADPKDPSGALIVPPPVGKDIPPSEKPVAPASK
jgi:hypothetical protein